MATHNKGVKMMIMKKRSAQEWLQDDNLSILQGLALQCMTLGDLASVIGISHKTLNEWRKKYPEINEAIDIGREEADAVIISTNFNQALNGSETAMERWYRYRIGPRESKYYAKQGETDDKPIIIDDIWRKRE